MTASHLKQTVAIRLSQQELRAISREINQDFSPSLAVSHLQSSAALRLSPKELRTIGEEISREFAPMPVTGVAELVLLPVDPTHVYAYWHLTDAQMTSLSETVPDDKDEEPLTLRIYSQPPEHPVLKPPTVWVDVAIDASRTQQSVQIPDAIAKTNDAVFYAAVIGKRDSDNHITPFAQSNTLHYAGTAMASLVQQDHDESTAGVSSFHYLLNKTPRPILV